MNISSTILATSAFIFLLLPGFIFLRAFWGSDKGSLTSNNFYTYLIWGTFVSTIIYIIFGALYNLLALLAGLFPCDMSFQPTFEYVRCSYSGISIEKICHLIQNYSQDDRGLISEIYKLLFLTLVSSISAFFGGGYLQDIIVRKKWDEKYKFLKFKNDWYYLLKGNANGANVQLCFICEIGSSVVVYIGNMCDYQLKDEELDYITLTGVHRTAITQWNPKILDDSISFTHQQANDAIDMVNKNPKLYRLDGSMMLFKASEIKNVHITYQEPDFPNAISYEEVIEAAAAQTTENEIAAQQLENVNAGESDLNIEPPQHN